MLTNFHTHTTFSDGKNTPEEIVIYAIENGYSAIGFSDHSYTPFDLRYCMQDEAGYIADVKRVKEKYKDKIEVYLGIEEDIFSVHNKGEYEYIIGSSHYFCVDGKYYALDSNSEHMTKCLEVFNQDIVRLSKTYYETLCHNIKIRKPDICGHFDVITKFEEVDGPLLFCNEEYFKISEKYLNEIVNDCIIEVNTGAMSRGIRTSAYPHERLLHAIKKQGGKIILSSDSHQIETLDYSFKETINLLKDIGFEGEYVLSEGEFKLNRF